jgi:hypothetical protein
LHPLDNYINRFVLSCCSFLEYKTKLQKIIDISKYIYTTYKDFINEQKILSHSDIPGRFLVVFSVIIRVKFLKISIICFEPNTI